MLALIACLLVRDHPYCHRLVVRSPSACRCLHSDSWRVVSGSDDKTLKVGIPGFHMNIFYSSCHFLSLSSLHVNILY